MSSISIELVAILLDIFENHGKNKAFRFLTLKNLCSPRNCANVAHFTKKMALKHFFWTGFRDWQDCAITISLIFKMVLPRSKHLGPLWAG